MTKLKRRIKYCGLAFVTILFAIKIYSYIHCSKWAVSPPGGDFQKQGGEQNKEGDMWVKQHEGGENAQPLIDH